MEKQFLEDYESLEKKIRLLLELNIDSISFITEIHRFIELNVNKTTKLIRSFKYEFYSDYSTYKMYDFEEYKNNIEDIYEQNLQNKYETLSVIEYC